MFKKCQTYDGREVWINPYRVESIDFRQENTDMAVVTMASGHIWMLRFDTAVTDILATKIVRVKGLD